MVTKQQMKIKYNRVSSMGQSGDSIVLYPEV